MTNTHYDNSNIVVGSSGKKNWDGGIKFGDNSIGIGGGGYNWDDKYVVISLSSQGIPDVLSFSYNASSSATGKDWRVYEGTSKTSVTTQVWSSTNGNGSASIKLSKTTKFIKLVYSGNLTGTFKTIKVSERKFISLEQTEAKSSTKDNTTTKDINFGETYVDATTPSSALTQTFKVDWCNLKGPITLTSSHPDIFSISPTSISASKGSYASTPITVTVTMSRSQAADFSTTPATITIKDAGNEKSAIVSLYGKTNKRVPVIDVPPAATAINYGLSLANSSISGGLAHDPINNANVAIDHWEWNNPSTIPTCGQYQVILYPSDTRVYTTATTMANSNITPISQTITWTQAEGEIDGDITLMATTSAHDVTVYYTSSDETVATISGTRLIMHQSNREVTITAHADANCNYTAAATVSKTFSMPDRISPTITASASAITYGQTLSQSTITATATYNGATVSGVFAWVEPLFQPETTVGTPETFLVSFTPTDRDRYASMTVNVPVQVNKLTPEITYIGCPLWREKSTYSNPFRTTNNEIGYSSVTFSPNDGTLSWDGTSIVVGTVTTERNYTVTVCQEATQHFDAKCQQFTYPVRKKSEVCLPVVQFKDDYGAGALNPEIYNKMRVSGDGTWCFENGTHSDTYLLVSVTYNTHMGMQIGTWRDGFDVGGDGRSIVLYYTGVPDKLSIKTKSESPTSTSLVHYPISNLAWRVQQSVDGNSWDAVVVKTSSDINISNRNLNPNSRYIKITYYGNFAGYIPYEDFRLTLRHGFEIGADRNQVSEYTIPQFGTAAHPLQVPQQLTFRYYGLGVCDGENEKITVTSDNENFYADVEQITENVSIDQWGEYTLTIRCTDVGQTGNITLRADDGTTLTLHLSSVTPTITSTNASDVIFYTGTEQNHKTDDDMFYGMTALDFSQCFNASGAPLYDYLFFAGVTGNTNAVGSKFDYYDPYLGYWLPSLNVPNETDDTPCNAHTPYFVYRKSGNQYVFDHTVRADNTRLGSIDLQGKTAYLTGYTPFAYTGADLTEGGFANFTGNGDLYLDDLTMYSRYHTSTGAGRATDYDATDLTLYLGNNFFSATGALLTFSNADETNIHVQGSNILRSADGAKIGKAKGRSRDINVEMTSIQNTIVPSPTLAFLPNSGSDPWTLTIDDKWIDGSNTEGVVFLQSTLSDAQVDVGTEYGKVIAAETVSPYSSPTVRLTMTESHGQGFSLYGVGEQYTKKADAWTAAKPGDNVEAKTTQKRLVYMNTAEGAGQIEHSGSYHVTEQQNLLLTAPADHWQVFVAPFDIKAVYVLEAMPETDLENAATKAEALTLQSTVCHSTVTALKQDILPNSEGLSADKSLVVLLSNWIGEQRDEVDHCAASQRADYSDRGLWELEHYDGTNIWSASWYLYELTNPEQTWRIRRTPDAETGSMFYAEWQPVKAQTGNVIMKKGHVYSWQLPYCPMCEENDNYDYWTNKWLLFEGTGSQDLAGSNFSRNTLSTAKTNATDNTNTAYFSGNTALSPIVLPTDMYVHDNDPNSDTYDCFVNKAAGETIEPLTACLIADIPVQGGTRVRAITRTGQVVYEEESTVDTSVSNEVDSLLSSHPTAKKIVKDGQVMIVVGDKLYDVVGRRIE